ncbi:LacI family transcription regulator [Pontibacillus halophilus JSM 076056 = DSM 19796]|uniref:LacI family transcription regulator n=1 Tax=Pontibacillus halophilus JSM 076056 = DSM 19796 TaxID=1385510 RepID=A0A0A5GH92_9BACI|nr:LacI family DNA-binding transcriptional regulator [Pontibacillus halophilus]KGX92626.1 LacI family transcription regulator [Pontibacillus halophilus JSM 076056 = DSM 19796]
MPTIEDVAKQAGLSRTTVSRVINDQPYVAEEKRQRVKEAMDLLGYVPNSSARRLRNQKTETIAILLPNITNPFFSHLIEAMEIKASAWGYRVIICQTHEDEKKELDYLELLRTKQVDGVIMTAVRNEWSKIKPYLTYGPIVLCNENVRGANLPVVYVDHEQAAYEATRHLIQQGCRHLAYLSGGNDSIVAQNRQKGFLKALNQSGLSPVLDEKMEGAYTIDHGRDVLHSLVQHHPNVDGVFTGSDEVAAGMIHEAKQLGLRVPDDLAVVGFDNQAISLLMSPSITTVEQPVTEMGEHCVETLVHYIEHPSVLFRQEIVFRHQLLVRDSTQQRVTMIS